MGFSYPTSFRNDACRRMLDGERVEALAVELGVTAATLYRWKHQALVDAGPSVSTSSEAVELPIH